MASGEFGGGGSVVARLHVEGLKSESNSTVGKRHFHEIVDDVDDDDKFKIEIKLPADNGDKDAFLRAIGAALSGPPHANDRITVELPIEEDSEDENFPQIKISWKSKR
jgi:hypothetical protein